MSSGRSRAARWSTPRFVDLALAGARQPRGDAASEALTDALDGALNATSARRAIAAKHSSEHVDADSIHQVVLRDPFRTF
jgi:hypothetical protein